MKKKGGPEGQGEGGEGGEGLPDEDAMPEISAQARYGEDARKAVLWDLMRVRAQLAIRQWEEIRAAAAARANGADEPVRAEDGGTNGADEPDKSDRAEDGGPARLAFDEAVSKAIVEDDAEFFRELARMLETRVGGPPERRVDLEVSLAFSTLRRRAEKREGGLPTKKEVREAALFSLAFVNVMRRQERRRAWGEMHFFPDPARPAQLPAKLRQEVMKEMELLPEQNWTVIFQRCGLADLPSDKGGQPGHRKKR